MKKRSWLLVAVVLLLALPLVPLETSKNPGLWRVLSNAAHFGLFGAVALLVYFATGAGRLAGTGRLTVAAVVSGLAAFLVELVQTFVARTPSFLDFAIGALGIVVALVGVRLWSKPAPARVRLAHALAAGLAGFALVAPAWPELRAMAWRRHHFPVLGAFEDEIELRLWQPRHTSARSVLVLSPDHVGDGQRSLELRTAAGSWAGVQYTAGHTDWSGYDRLRWVLFNPGGAFELRLRIEDAGPADYASGFNRVLRVEPGWNRYAIGLDEIRSDTATDPLDTGRIARLALYTGRDEPSRVFYLDDVRLESGPRACATAFHSRSR